MDLSRVQQLYDDLQGSHLNMNRYEGEVHELVFEVLDAETFVAGIAATLIDGQRPERAALPILETTFLIGDSWMRRNGSRFDLRTMPEILDHARRVEALKEACGAALARTPQRH